MSEPDLKTEVDQFFASTGGDTPEPEAAVAETPVVAAAEASDGAPTKTFWDEVIDDPELSPSLRGKSVRDYVANTKKALADAHQAGYQKNEAEAKARVLEASNAMLMQQFQNLQAARPQPRPQQPHEAMGLTDPNDVYTQLPNVVNRIPAYVNQQTSQAVQQMREQEIAPLQGQVYQMIAEQAREKGRPTDIEKDTWEAIRPSVASIMWARSMSPADPNAWGEAAKIYRADAARMVPQQIKTEVTAPPTGNARPGAATAQAKKVATTGNKHLDKQLREHLAVWERNGIKMSFEEMADMIAGDPMRGMGGDW